MTLSDSIKGLILAVIVMGLFLYGLNYYRYSQNDPDFCKTCHEVKGAHGDWLKSKHRDTLCQQCHKLGNVEQNLRLISYVITGGNPISVTHGRLHPWTECASCHSDEIAQGTISPTKAYGHARHAGMQQIACNECHDGKSHNFTARPKTCAQCHEGKTVHGLDHVDAVCLQCHAFTQKRLPKFDRKTCTTCHSNIPNKGTMASVACHLCHKPHKKEKPTSTTCVVECHKNETVSGRHAKYWSNSTSCMKCHKPHTWKSHP
jgi:hypothetical protein